MNRFKISIIQLCATALALIFFFIPGMSALEIGYGSYYEGYAMRTPDQMSVAEVPWAGYSPEGAIVILILLFAVTLACLVIFVINTVYHYNKAKGLEFCTKKAFVALPAAQLMLFLVYTIFICGKDWVPYGETWFIVSATVSILFFFELLIFLGVLGLDCFKYFVKKAEEPAVKAQKKAPASSLSVPDELERYKELFDKGVITQEEFDAKRKQLLNL